MCFCDRIIEWVVNVCVVLFCCDCKSIFVAAVLYRLFVGWLWLVAACVWTIISYNVCQMVLFGCCGVGKWSVRVPVQGWRYVMGCKAFCRILIGTRASSFILYVGKKWSLQPFVLFLLVGVPPRGLICGTRLVNGWKQAWWLVVVVGRLFCLPLVAVSICSRRPLVVISLFFSLFSRSLFVMSSIG